MRPSIPAVLFIDKEIVRVSAFIREREAGSALARCPRYRDSLRSRRSQLGVRAHHIIFEGSDAGEDLGVGYRREMDDTFWVFVGEQLLRLAGVGEVDRAEAHA